MPFDKHTLNTKYCLNITRAVQWHCAIGHTKILPASIKTDNGNMRQRGAFWKF